jgi:hypothetical protein
VPIGAEDMEPDLAAWIAEEEVVQARAMAQARSKAPRLADPKALGYPDEAALHAAARRAFGIPAERPIQVLSGERKGRPVVKIIVGRAKRVLECKWHKMRCELSSPLQAGHHEHLRDQGKPAAGEVRRAQRAKPPSAC